MQRVPSVAETGDKGHENQAVTQRNAGESLTPVVSPSGTPWAQPRLSDPNVYVDLFYAKRLGALEMVARLYLLTNHPEDRKALVREVNLNFPGWPPIPEE